MAVSSRPTPTSPVADPPARPSTGYARFRRAFFYHALQRHPCWLRDKRFSTTSGKTLVRERLHSALLLTVLGSQRGAARVRRYPGLHTTGPGNLVQGFPGLLRRNPTTLVLWHGHSCCCYWYAAKLARQAPRPSFLWRVGHE